MGGVHFLVKDGRVLACVECKEGGCGGLESGKLWSESDSKDGEGKEGAEKEDKEGDEGEMGREEV